MPLSVDNRDLTKKIKHKVYSNFVVRAKPEKVTIYTNYFSVSGLYYGKDIKGKKAKRD